MNYTFHPEAEEEFFEAITYYEACDEGLGLDFALAIYAAVNHAVRCPKSWPLVEGEIRRCQTVRFPYSILYAEEAGGFYSCRDAPAPKSRLLEG